MGREPGTRQRGSLAMGLAVMRQYVRIGWIRKSQFRLEFVNQVLMDLVFYASFVLTFEFLYGLEGGGKLSLAGWSYAEMRVYLGMAFVADALMMTFLGQQWHFGADLKDGKLDGFRTKPGSTAFLYFYQRFSPEGLTNLVFATAWLAFALVGAAGVIEEPLWLFLTVPAAIAAIAWSQAFLMLFYSTFELFVLHSGIGHLVSHMLSNLAERPLDVYPGALERVLLFVVPIAGIAWYPASLVLGRVGPAFAFGYPAVLFAFAVLARWLFKNGLRRYESAMG